VQAYAGLPEILSKILKFMVIKSDQQKIGRWLIGSRGNIGLNPFLNIFDGQMGLCFGEAHNHSDPGAWSCRRSHLQMWAYGAET